jgi:hypothetical protein
LLLSNICYLLDLDSFVPDNGGHYHQVPDASNVEAKGFGH